MKRVSDLRLCSGHDMIKFVSGDILKAADGYIVQGVAEGNQEGLGTGLALKISKKWPDVQSAFKKHCRSGAFRGGSIWTHQPADDRPGFVYLATQPDMYHAKLSYLRKALRKMSRWADSNGLDRIHLPKIGAGLGKLSWKDEVKPLLIELLGDRDTEYLVYEDFTRDMED